MLAATIAASTAYSTLTYAQNMIDGVRFSGSDISGTARYRSMAGAFGALGGDLSCMSDNPAGLAIYRGTNVFSITPHLSFNSTETKGSMVLKTSDNNVSISNLGVLLSFKPEYDYLVNFNVGFSIERRLESFRKMNAAIDHPTGNFSRYLFEQANSFLDDYNLKASYLGNTAAWSDDNCPLLPLMAYESYVLDDDVYDPNHVVSPRFDEVYQQTNLKEHTRHDNYNISGSFNFNDVLYAGVTVRITDFNSMIEHCFSEDSRKDMNGDYITYDNRTETKGSGVGINLGLLWRPTDEWRLGAAVHTPVWMNMRHFDDAAMETENVIYREILEVDPTAEAWSEWNDEFEYDFSTPWEYQFSTAYVIGTKAIVSLEYDLSDLTTMKFSPSRDGSRAEHLLYEDLNKTSRQYLKAQHTFKGGIEYRITPQISLRAGYAYKTSPYKKNALFTDVDPDDVGFLYRTATKPNYSTLDDQHYITGGIGWRGKSWTFDLSCMSHSISEYYSPYPCDYADSDILDFNTHTLNWDLSIGYRF